MTTRTDAPPRSAIDSRGVRATVWGACAVAVLSLVSAGAADPVPASEPVQPPVSNSGNAELETVTVEAQRKRLEERISTFVSSITIPAHESLARWQVPVCLLVAGLPRSRGEFVLERISRTATDAGIPLAPPDCAPNFLVIVTAEPEVLLKEWWGRDPRLFNRERGLGGVRRLIDTDQPVRVWHNACDVAPGLARSFQMKGGPHCGTGELGSRLTWDAVRAIYSVIVVVDTGYIKGLNDVQVADYISMVGPAQIRKSPELGTAATILRLFAETEGERPPGLSDWDQAFLKSLYAANADEVTQLSQMKRRMGQALAP